MPACTKGETDAHFAPALLYGVRHHAIDTRGDQQQCAGTVKSTGNSFRNVWSQKYVVRDGPIVEMSEYNIQVEPRE